MRPRPGFEWRSTACLPSWMRRNDEMEKAGIGEEKAEREGDLGRAAELRYGRLIELSKQLEGENRSLQELQTHGKMLKEEVDEEDVAEIVSKWTRIPVSRMLEGELQKL